jgi:outer membrane protein
MKIYLFILIFVLLHSGATSASDNSITLTREYIESEAIKSAHNIKTLSAEVDAFKNRVDIQQSLRFPKISLDGSYKYITEVPTLKFPGGASSKFGDNQNYSIGPILTWTLLDFGNLKYLVNSFKASENAKVAESESVRRQVIFNARLNYFKVQLRIEQQHLVSDSLKLVESQYKDIQNKINVGSSNRIDLLSAHKDVLNLKIQSRQIQTDLISDLRDLYTLMGKNESVNIADPIKVDSISSSVIELMKYQKYNFDKLDFNQHPLIKMHTANAEALRLTAESFKANQLPKLTFFAKTSIDYPNGPLLENFNQNTIGINFSMPLFEGSRSTNEAAEKQNMSIASEHRRDQARIELIRDINKAQDQLKGLLLKIEFYKDLVKESEERSKLIYAAYKIGRSSFLEVQSANLQALEAKVQSTTNDVQVLIQLAYLASISEEQ